MSFLSKHKQVFILGLLLSSLVFSGTSSADLPIEKVPNVASLPDTYPDSWIFAHDANFQALIAGKVIILDVAADTKEYKGAVDAAQFATFIESSTNNELYVGETFFDRGTRGKRTDVVTIYDKQSLNSIGEIILPGSKRAHVVANKYSLRLVDNDKYLLVFNLTPATSVTIIDIASREILNEISIPGCSMVYPSGQRGFSSLCGDGSMLSVAFDKAGQIVEKTKLDRFFNIDEDALFDKPAYIGTTAYFPTFHSSVQVIDMSGVQAKLSDKWSLVSKKEAKENWRPSGWQIAGASQAGDLYVLMQKDGFNGSHKTGGQQVWVYDVKTHKKIREIKLASDGFSIALTHGDKPNLVVTNVNMGVDVYSLKGKLQRSFNVGDSAMPILLHTKR